MQMRDCLSSQFLAIDDEPIPVLNVQFLGEFSGHDMQMAQERDVFFFEIGVSRDHLPGDDEHMGRRLGIDVSKSQALIILINDVRRDFLVYNLQEKVVLKHGWHYQ